jgi:hypothetical protein
LKNLYGFPVLRDQIGLLASISRSCPRLRIIDVDGAHPNDLALYRQAFDAADWINPVVVDGLERLDFLSLLFHGSASWGHIKLLLEAVVPRLKAFYLDVNVCCTHPLLGPETRSDVGGVLRTLGLGYRSYFRVCNTESSNAVRVIVKFALLPAFDDPREHFFKDLPFFQA